MGDLSPRLFLYPSLINDQGLIPLPFNKPIFQWTPRESSTPTLFDPNSRLIETRQHYTKHKTDNRRQQGCPEHRHDAVADGFLQGLKDICRQQGLNFRAKNVFDVLLNLGKKSRVNFLAKVETHHLFQRV